MLTKTFSALSDPTRRSIVELLNGGDLSVGELVNEFTISQSAISRHLQILEHAGLISRRREGARRLCRLNGEPLREVNEWVSAYRVGWESKLERLDRVIHRKRNKLEE